VAVFDLHLFRKEAVPAHGPFDEFLDLGFSDDFPVEFSLRPVLFYEGFEAGVGQGDPAVPIQHDEPFPDRGDHLGQLFFLPRNLPEEPLYLARHRIERCAQFPEFVPVQDRYARFEPPRGNLPGGSR